MELEKAHLITHTGTIVDATFVEAPRQRNSKEDRAEIKQGNVPEEWKKPKNIHKLRQKDVPSYLPKMGHKKQQPYLRLLLLVYEILQHIDVKSSNNLS